MNGRQLRLNDGTTYPNGSAGLAEGFLWCTIPGGRLEKIAPVFLNKEKTTVILYDYGEMQDRFEGFTQVWAMQTAADSCSVCLVKEEA